MSTARSSALHSLHRHALFAVAVLVCAGGALLLSSEASAQGRPLLIVPFEREQVDDAFFNRYMDQIRSDAEASDAYKPMEKIDQTLNDLLFAVGCAEPQPECLQLIGETFNAEVILYGSLWRNDRQTLHTVQMYDLLTGTSLLDVPIESTYETDDDEQLFRRLVAEVQQVFFPYTGQLIVTTTEPAAEILFDGAPVGNTNTGPLELSGRPLGEHAVSARIGDKEVSETIVLMRNEKPEVLIDMSKEPVVTGGTPHLGSYIAFGVGGAALIGGGVFSFLTSSAQSDADDLMAKQVLSEGEVTDANTVLTNGPTFQTVQFVLYGVGAASVITGAVLYFLFEGSEGEAAPAEPAAGEAYFMPTVSEDAVGATAGFTF